MGENLVVLKLSDIPVFGTISVQIYKDSNEQNPKMILDSNPEIQDEKQKVTIDKLLKTLSIQTDLSEMHFEGDDLVFRVDRKAIKGTIDTLAFKGIVKFKDYNKYLRDVVNFEKENKMSIVDATLEKEKIGTIPLHNEYLVTLRDFMHKIEGSPSKIQLNEKMLADAEKALKEERSKDSLINKLKNLRSSITTEKPKKKISRENKYAGKSMQLSETAKKVVNGIAIAGVSLAAIAGVNQLTDNALVEDMPSVESLNGYSYSTDIDRGAIIANGEKNSGQTIEETTEETTEYNEREEEIKYLHEEYGFDIKFIENLFNSGLEYDEVRNQLIELSETMNESNKTR